MLNRILVEGLNDGPTRELTFYPDLNILTGRNGCGKTTLLKLIWYLVSGNLERIPAEISFRRVTFETDEFSLVIGKSEDKKKMPRIDVEFTPQGKPTQKFSETRRGQDLLNHLNHSVVALINHSIFFSTFRRIEGGFETSLRETGINERYRRPSSIGSAMEELAASLSVVHPLEQYRHTFVAAISTRDIIDLLTREYALVSRQTNAAHAYLSTEISRKLTGTPALGGEDAETDASRADEAIALLRSIGSMVSEVAKTQEALLQPFSVLSSLATKLFRHPGIIVSESIVFGERDGAIRSDDLSAGEKQMLSFLSYNAFIRKSPFFIDEPELSLHVDWQRILLPTLLSQGSQNQFFIATHSPFIYSRYPDREIPLDDDRGYSGSADDE